MTDQPIVPAPTQSAHPWRASLRTGGAVLVAGLAAAAAVGPEIVQFVEAQFPGSPAVAYVVSGVGIVTGLSVAVNRIALLAPVTKFLTMLGLGPAPKSEVAA
ncbi:MAG: uncharacterized protein K0S65_2079 [Labilithrix sp.]|nr:uncharacterized protein [Labilithrix sp.]